MSNEGFIPKAGYTQFPYPPSERIHVIPLNDDRSHIESGISCPCAPSVVETGRIVIHNSFDGREFTEEEERRIRAGDAYDPEDSDISDAIIARGKPTRWAWRTVRST